VLLEKHPRRSLYPPLASMFSLWHAINRFHNSRYGLCSTLLLFRCAGPSRREAQKTPTLALWQLGIRAGRNVLSRSRLALPWLPRSGPFPVSTTVAVVNAPLSWRNIQYTPAPPPRATCRRLAQPPAGRASHLRDLVQRRLGETGSARIVACQPSAADARTALFRLDLTSGGPLVLKVHQHDRWRRLEQECAALRALEQVGRAAVPRLILADHEQCFAVYSFVPGHVRAPASLDVAWAQASGLLAVALHRATPVDVSGSSSPLNACSRSTSTRS
jgi:hypothetical protein